MTKIRRKSFKNSATFSRNNKSNIHYFQITSLSFRIRMKIDVCTKAKPHAIFQSFFVGNVRFYSQFYDW